MGKVDQEDQMYEAAMQNQANFGQPDDLELSLQNLQKALEAGNYTAPALQVLDLNERAQKYLTESARHDMQRRAPKQLQVTEDSKVYQAVYFSCIVKTGNEERGIEEMAKIANDLSQRGLLHSVLAPPSACELARLSSVAKSAVFFFPLVPIEAVKDCEALYKEFHTKEGGLGVDLEDMSVQLADGEFLADIRVTVMMSMIMKMDEGIDADQLVKKQIDQYLAILPKGTEVRSVTKLAVTDLSVPFEVKFYNALLQRVKKVDLEYVREIARFDGGLHQFNLVTGIRFFDKDGKDLYRYNDGSL